MALINRSRRAKKQIPKLDIRINWYDYNSEEILQDLVIYGHDALDLGPEQNLKMYRANYTLYKAIQNGCAHVVRVLIDRGVNLTQNLYGHPALHRAAECDQFEIVAMILDAGVDVNCRSNTRNETALNTAARKNAIRTARLLLSRGADPESVDFWNYTPLHMAASAGSVTIMKMIMSFIPDHRKVEYVNTNATSNGIIAQVETAIQTAVMYNRLHAVKYLVAQFANVTDIHTDKNTLLHLAAIHPNGTILRFLLDIPACRDLVNYNDYNGDTALHIAALYEAPRCILALLQHGADPTIVDNSGNLPIDVCKKREVITKDAQECIDLLTGGGWSTKAARRK